MRCDRIWRNANLATMSSVGADLGIVHDGLVACRDGIIVHAGTAATAPEKLEATEVIDCQRRWITPGLIDCHTHLVYAGDRAHEFEQRLNGVSYEAITRAGGGIRNTMDATRAASEAELVASTLPRLDALLAEGVTTVEIKSGYGLALEHERKQMRASRALELERRITVRNTFLGAHALPPEFTGRADEYVEEVAARMLPALSAEGLVDAVDVYCERIGFSAPQTRRVFEAAAALGVRVKVHAGQLSDLGGAQLAASCNALSADHLEYLDANGIAAMDRAGTTAVLLPGSFYFLRETKLPPVAELRAAGVPMAIATDSNPGTSPLTSPLMAMNLAATLFRMTVEECLLGMTRNAARALGLADRVGSLEAGKRCDLAIWDIERPAQLVYRMGFNPLNSRVWNGA